MCERPPIATFMRLHRAGIACCCASGARKEASAWLVHIYNSETVSLSNYYQAAQAAGVMSSDTHAAIRDIGHRIRNQNVERGLAVERSNMILTARAAQERRFGGWTPKRDSTRYTVERGTFLPTAIS